jgi:hypothetical protein
MISINLNLVITIPNNVIKSTVRVTHTIKYGDWTGVSHTEYRVSDQPLWLYHCSVHTCHNVNYLIALYYTACQDKTSECAYMMQHFHVCEDLEAAVHYGCLESCGLCGTSKSNTCATSSHSYTYSHAYIHACTNTHMHSHTHACVHMHTNQPTYAYIHTRTYTHTHTHTHEYTDIHADSVTLMQT